MVQLQDIAIVNNTLFENGVSFDLEKPDRFNRIYFISLLVLSVKLGDTSLARLLSVLCC
jgi:hypothetical protein